jgi:hypothetical protein
MINKFDFKTDQGRFNRSKNQAGSKQQSEKERTESLKSTVKMMLCK